MSIEEIDFREAGEGLLKAAEEAAFSPRGKVSELFPYIYEASRRLSTRAISRYLAEEHGIKLSAVSVAKALRNEEKHWEEFADFIQPRAHTIAKAYKIEIEDILFNRDVFDHLDKMTPVVDGQEGMDELDSTWTFIRDRWYSLSEAVRDSCYQYLIDEGDGTEEESANE